MVLATAALLDRDPRPGDGAIDTALASQICWCGSYQRIRAAVHRADGHKAGALAGNDSAESVRTAADAAGADGGRGGADADRWGPPLPGGPQHRPRRPWDLTALADRD
jgi:isoquinoline 1-oxidoreductase alpha subunit